jgi:hypothetical protein
MCKFYEVGYIGFVQQGKRGRDKNSKRTTYGGVYSGPRLPTVALGFLARVVFESRTYETPPRT